MRRYHITVGAKTTVNGTVLTGYEYSTINGQAMAREGDEVDCPECDSTGVIVCDGPHLVDLLDGRNAALDGDLCSCKCDPPPRLIANQNLRCQLFNDGAVAPRPRAAAPVAARQPVAEPRPAGFAPAPSPPTPGWFSSAEAAEPGFYIVPSSMSGEQVLAQLAPATNPPFLGRLQTLNPTFAQGFKAGELFVLGDPRNPMACTREEADLMAAAAQVRTALAPLSAEEANFMVRHQAEIALMAGGASESLGVARDMLDKGLKQVEGTLKNLELLHQQQFSRHGHLRSPEFFDARRQLYHQLDAQLKGALLNKQLNLGSYDSLRRDLGISTRSLVHHWSRSGAPGQIPGYATHMEQIAKGAQYLRYGGYLGVGLGGASSILKVQEVCRAGETEECRKIRFTEAGSFFGGMAGGSALVAGARAGAGPICAAIGLGSAGMGGALCVLLVIGGTSYAGALGGEAGGEWMGDFLFGKLNP
ncbi:PAAR motif protein [compost metagenome]